jgi:Tfp pilus assembly protein PilN
VTAEAQDNGRVTLALLGQKLDTFIEAQNRQNALLERHIIESETRFRTLDIKQAEQAKDITQLDETVDRLQARDIAGTVAGVVTGIIAGFIAWFRQ